MEVCKVCGKVHALGKRVNLGIVATKEELKEITDLMSANEAIAQATSLRNVPNDVTQELMDKFVNSLIKEKQKIVTGEKDFWNKMIEKYKLIGNVYIDFSSGNFYYMEETHNPA